MDLVVVVIPSEDEVVAILTANLVPVVAAPELVGSLTASR